MSSKRRQEPTRHVGVHYDGDLRSDLVAAAAERVAAVGVENLSLRDVARRIGVSHAAPAHHFGDKSGLLTAVAAAGFDLFVQHLGAVIAEITDRPEHLLVRMAQAYADFAEQHAGYFDVMFRPALIDVDDPAYVQSSQAAFDGLEIAISHCQRLGWRPEEDTRTLALAAWSFAHGITSLLTSGALQRHSDSPEPRIADIALALISNPAETRKRRARS